MFFVVVGSFVIDSSKDSQFRGVVYDDGGGAAAGAAKVVERKWYTPLYPYMAAEAEMRVMGKQCRVHNGSAPRACSVIITLDHDMEGPVYVHYGVKGMLQNHLRYRVKQRGSARRCVRRCIASSTAKTVYPFRVNGGYLGAGLQHPFENGRVD